MKPYLNVIAPRLLDWVEYFSPLGTGGDGIVGIANMTLGPLIISAEPMDSTDETHEVIHVYQWIEMALLVSALAALAIPLLGLPLGWVVATAAWAWLPGVGAFSVVYGTTYFYWLLRLKLAPGTWTGFDAYTLIPFEREAYLYDQDPEYLAARPWFAWTRIGRLEADSSERTWSKHVLATILTLRRAEKPGE